MNDIDKKLTIYHVDKKKFIQKKIILPNIFYSKFKELNLNKFSKYLFNDLFSIMTTDQIFIFYNSKRTDIIKYIGKKYPYFCFFFVGAKLSINKRVRASLVNVNSFCTKYTNYGKISNKKFNYIAKTYIKFNDKLSYNNNGKIIIYVNNSTGWWGKFINLENLEKLVEKIRLYKNNEIVIRLHEKDFKDKKFSELINILDKKFDDKVYFDKQSKPWNKIINEVHCVFIQNSFTLFELMSYGIPIFRMEEVVSYNIYDDLYYPKDEEMKYFNDLSLYKIDRKKLLKKYYSHLVFEYDAKKLVDFVTHLYKSYYLN